MYDEYKGNSDTQSKKKNSMKAMKKDWLISKD